MSLSRYALLSALWSRLKTSVPSVKTFAPVGDHGFQKFTSTQQPVLCVVAGNESPKQTRGEPTIWRVVAHVLVYLSNEDEELILDILDEVEKALEVKAGEEGDGVHTTLNGLVNHCWISGSVEIYEGDFAEQAMLSIPVEMLAVA